MKPVLEGVSHTVGKTVQLWVPYPMSDGNQEIADVEVVGNFTRQGVYREGKF